jgi:hypothetical protein
VTIEQLRDHERGEIVGSHMGEASAETADRRTHTVYQIYGLQRH